MRLHSPETDVDSPPYDSAGLESSTAPPRWHRRLAWTGGILALIVLLVLAPPFINANRYRNKIAQTMSGSLGRPVHLDNVSLHLLPVPGFTLRNLVVSDSPEFGAEPIIRANTVEATLRATSLWHHPVEFSTIRFLDPSVNLVRNAEGRWNLSDVLLHASHVESAPTDQRRAGPTPRFPYIEATGGRVNIKLGAEKLPFSLTDTDLALWLPSPQQWRVRLNGHPARTDTNITDPGTLRIEGQLRRASTAREVPVNFRASWHNAPLGEATRILAGDDWGWRGTLNLDATMAGTLGDAQVNSKLTLGGLRRAEFFPARPLDLQITCASGFGLYPADLSNLHCLLPDEAPTPLALDAATVHLPNVGATAATLKGDGIPARWALLWAALFSARVPTDLHPTGTVDVDVAHNPGATVPPAKPVLRRVSRRRGASAPPPAFPQGPWTGTVRVTLPGPESTTTAAASASQTGTAATVLSWQLVTSPNGSPALHLPPTPIILGPNASVTVAATVGESGYSVSVGGSASPAALLEPARYLPQLGDGIENVMPYPATASASSRVQFTCTRSWSAAQTCSGPQPVGNGTRPPSVPAGATSVPTQGLTAPPLAPRSLSPLENAPLLARPPQ